MKKQILIFSHGYNAPFVDVCNQYAAIFDRAEYEINVAYLVGEETAEIRHNTLADHVYFFDQKKNTVRGLKFTIVNKLLTLCREKQFSMIICHRYKPAYITALVALLVKIPKIFVVMHELGVFKRRSRQWFVYWLGRKKLTLAGVSNAVREDLLRDAKFLKPEHVVVLPNVLEVDRFATQLIDRTSARRALGLQEHEFVFGNIGRLVNNKDQATLLIAFAKVVAQLPQAKLVIMGTGALAIKLTQLAEEQQITNNIIFTGFIAGAFRYVKAFDVLVSSAIQEAFGRVLLEAMVGSVPVIATRVHGVPEVLGDTNILVAAKQPDALATAMLHVANLPTAQLQAMGKQGLERVCAHFSIHAFRALFFRLLEIT